MLTLQNDSLVDDLVTLQRHVTKIINPSNSTKPKVGCGNLGRLPQLGFLIFFGKIFLVNLINHNLYGVEISTFFNFLYFLGLFENFSILEVEIGGTGLEF